MFGTIDRPNARRPRRVQLTALLTAATLFAALVCPSPWMADAQAESKIARVTKNALYGAGLGLLLGAVSALVIEKDNRDDAIKWGIVLGTFGGFGYGVYSIAAGEDDEFFHGSRSASPDAVGFDGRSEFVGTHGRWTQDSNDASAVAQSTGLLSGESHAHPLVLAAE